MLASRLTAYFRKKCVTITDRRVRLMNEILVCIKFIKMYCWEDSFAQNIHSECPLVLSSELRYLCKAASPSMDSFWIRLDGFLIIQTLFVLYHCYYCY